MNLGLRRANTISEIEFDKIDKAKRLQVTIVTTATTKEQGKKLFEGLVFRLKINMAKTSSVVKFLHKQKFAVGTLLVCFVRTCTRLYETIWTMQNLFPTKSVSGRDPRC